MRKILVLLGILFSIAYVSLTASNVFAIEKGRECKPDKYISGIDAWPLGCEAQFPWKSIQGLWRVIGNGGDELYLSFKVSSYSGSNNKFVSIKQYSNNTCNLESWGKGDINYKNTVVKALMTDGYTQYMMTIRAFMESVLQKAAPATVTNGKAVTVMTLYPIGEQDREQAFKLQKVSSDPVFLCNQ